MMKMLPLLRRWHKVADPATVVTGISKLLQVVISVTTLTVVGSFVYCWLAGTHTLGTWFF